MFGVEYLLAQQGQQLCVSTEELNKEIDEGFEDIEDIETTEHDLAPAQEGPVDTVPPNRHSEEEAEEVNMSSYVLEIVHFFVAIALYLRISFVLQTIVDDGEEAVDSRGVAEWDKVDALAEALVSLRGLSVTSTQAEKLIELYANLPDFDKKPIIFNPQPHKPSRPPPHAGALVVMVVSVLVVVVVIMRSRRDVKKMREEVTQRGRFARKKRAAFQGVEATKR